SNDRRPSLPRPQSTATGAPMAIVNTARIRKNSRNSRSDCFCISASLSSSLNERSCRALMPSRLTSSASRTRAGALSASASHTAATTMKTAPASDTTLVVLGDALAPGPHQALERVPDEPDDPHQDRADQGEEGGDRAQAE